MLHGLVHFIGLPSAHHGLHMSLLMAYDDTVRKGKHRKKQYLLDYDVGSFVGDDIVGSVGVVVRGGGGWAGCRFGEPQLELELELAALHFQALLLQKSYLVVSAYVRR